MANLRLTSACVSSRLAHGHHVPQASAKSWKPRHQGDRRDRNKKVAISIRGSLCTCGLIGCVTRQHLSHHCDNSRCRVTQCSCDCSTPPLNISTANASAVPTEVVGVKTSVNGASCVTRYRLSHHCKRHPAVTSGPVRELRCPGFPKHTVAICSASW